MKIGIVRQTTGLTDRTIRYYIEEGLLQPTCTQNHLGRKSFDFTQEHVTLLHQISILRKYGFSITDIKTILEDPSQSSGITRELIEKKKQTIKTEQILLDTLLQLDKQKDYTLPELADALDSPVLADVKVPKDSEIPVVTQIFRTLFWFAWGIAMFIYVLSACSTIISFFQDFLYAKFYPFSLATLYTVLSWLFPLLIAAMMLLISCRRMQKKRILQTVLTIALTVAYLIGWFWILLAPGFANPLIYSETQAIENYMQIGAVEKESDWIPILFPDEVPAQALGENGTLLPDTTRYYNITESPWGPRYELFAQWRLSSEELGAEMVRLEQNFSEANRYIVENKDWVCWIFMNSSSDCTDIQVSRLQYILNDQQVKVWDDYEYYCFAYRIQDGVVRYIASYSSDGGGTPIFTQLDWD